MIEEREIIDRGIYHIPLDEPPRTVLDLGANQGLFTVWAHRRWPDAKIRAYEPWPENIEGFKRNINGSPNIELIEAAVRAEAGVAPMCRGRNPLCCSFTAQEGPVVEVPCVAAGTLPSAEFVKIDVEGDELGILPHLDLTATKALAVEVHDLNTVDQIMDLITSRGLLVHSRLTQPCLLPLLLFRRQLAKKRLFVGIPVYGAVEPFFMDALLSLQRDCPLDVALRPHFGDSLVPRARNILTGDFLETDCTDLLFIDSDLIFSPGQISRIMSHDVDVVAGCYPKKSEGKLQWVFNTLDQQQQDDERGLHKVRYIGTGFMRVRRCVFEKMIAHHGEQIRYTPDHRKTRTEYDFWSVGTYQYPSGFRRYLSEDWMFCQRWLDMGGDVYADTRIILKHLGHAVYPLKTQQAEIINHE